MGVTRLFVLVYKNEDDNNEILYQNELLIIITSSLMEKNFYGQPIDSDINWYKEIK